MVPTVQWCSTCSERKISLIRLLEEGVYRAYAVFRKLPRKESLRIS